MSMGTPMEIFAGGATAGAQGTGPHMAGVAVETRSGAGAQQVGGLAGGVGSTGRHD